MVLDLNKDFNKIKDYSETLLWSEDRQAAFNLIIFINQESKKIKLKETNGALYRKYNNIIRKLKWVCFDGFSSNGDSFSKEDIIKMFQKDFVVSFDVNDAYDAWEHLRLKLLQDLELDKRNEFKEKIRKALSENNEDIVKAGNIKKVSEWVKEYLQIVGREPANNINKLKFFQNHKEFKKLDKKNQEKIKKLVNLYERLKLSSRSLAGVEEEIIVPEEENPSTVIRDGKVITPSKRNEIMNVLENIFKGSNVEDKNKFNQAEKNNSEAYNIDSLLSTLNQYPVGSIERKAIEEEIKRLQKK